MREVVCDLLINFSKKENEGNNKSTYCLGLLWGLHHKVNTGNKYVSCCINKNVLIDFKWGSFTVTLLLVLLF
jgi:hypothetical protein